MSDRGAWDAILVDAAGAAALLSLGETKVRELASETTPAAERLPVVRVGQRLLFRPEGLARWAAEHEDYPAVEEDHDGEETRTETLSAPRRDLEAGRPGRARKPRASKAPLPLRVVE